MQRGDVERESAEQCIDRRERINDAVPCLKQESLVLLEVALVSERQTFEQDQQTTQVGDLRGAATSHQLC